ncbi:MAG: bleomycin resistance protein [Gammaproteobacteria bacterium]|nr:bleomycin resistance protein [Gammaproteobacteria bacterium]
MSVSSLGYITLTATDLSEWRTFGTEIMGLMLDDSSNDETLRFRMDDHPARLIVQAGDEDKLAAVGWEYADEAAYLAIVDALKASGAEVQAGDAAGAAARSVTAYSVSADRAGNPFEVYYGRTGLKDDFASPAGVGQFVTGEMGMGHVVLPAPNMDETHDFYTSVMGFGDSDNLTLPPPAESAPEMNIRFMHACNPRHHSLALFNYPVPTGIVHLILEVASIDDVGACLDRVQKAGYSLMSTLGRHCNDNMVSFYVVGPGGIAIEFGYDGLQIDWQNYQPTVSTKGDHWGHEYVPPVA